MALISRFGELLKEDNREALKASCLAIWQKKIGT